MQMREGFWREDAGAATIDWVVMCSGIIVLGIMVAYSVFNSGTAALIDSMNATLADAGTAEPGDAPRIELAAANDGTVGTGAVGTGAVGTGTVGTVAGKADGSNGGGKNGRGR